jgi:hypothetical protein
MTWLPRGDVDSEDPGKNNPLARHRAVVLGEAQPPRWQPLNFFLAMGDHAARCDGGIYLEEEQTGPEQIPLLALRQVDHEGRVWGEVWLSPSDLVQLIAGLSGHPNQAGAHFRELVKPIAQRKFTGVL